MHMDQDRRSTRHKTEPRTNDPSIAPCFVRAHKPPSHLALQKDSLRIIMNKYSVIYLVSDIVWRDQKVKRNATLSLRQQLS
jgi:hypothetical protein